MDNIFAFREVIEQYKVVFFDAFGVVKNYKGLVPGIEKTFEYLEAEKKEYYIVTNDASRSPVQLAEKYHQMGLKAISHDRIISSGMLAKEYLDLKVKDGIAAYLGTTDSAHYIESSGLHTLRVKEVTADNIQQVNALVFLDDEGFEWCRDLNKTVNLLRKRTIPVIVANTDDAYPLNVSEVCIAVGSIATMIENIVGKEFIRFGKPDSQMFMFAYDLVREKLQVTKKDIVMVGDTLHTDILGGNKFGLDTILVLSGNTLASEAETRINTTGIIPTYICQSAVIE
ncbi:HAD superfamily hydrolase (TIGR01459 family) [Arcticibacter tournemirensis]|uniref:TIGR01459 family HAD-type hydrolase n=1 Tax=Arcticibacter tournemirensis TaxID=699437 RepID=A0A4Q0MAT6_9SPHI|nr:TIGR01459 family HAD-type hydrolase [Arcticibacter tournemirensis]KAA8485033.1 TIGR01459 family HAD-type hydrolase [Arcticibacter tournemirensis]RXF70390.1 TIGR01459 family HAD-type hydrolase [Arcticibacter tournemirensis]TQM50511.1 HAD superfamily hydrolase (TIGR01459 family) [Arcticibacter tournemirensis]